MLVVVVTVIADGESTARWFLNLSIWFSLSQNGTEMANDLWCDAACRTQNVSHVVIQFHLIAD